MLGNDDELRIHPTPEQEEYFKDSVIRDDEGNLLICYHYTSGKPLFNEMNFLNVGTSGGLGRGPYFFTSSDAEYAKTHARNTLYATDAHCLAVYVNIKNPLMENDYGKISREQLAEILCRMDPKGCLEKSLREKILAKEKNPEQKNYKPPQKVGFFSSSETKLRNRQERAVYEVLQLGNPNQIHTDSYHLILLYNQLKKANPALDTEQWNKTIMEVTGFDGLIASNKEFTVFTTDQVKSVTNYAPKHDNRIFGDAPIESLKDLKEKQREEKTINADCKTREADIEAAVQKMQRTSNELSLDDKSR